MRRAAARRSSATSATRSSPFEPLARSPLAGVVFYELIGFKPADPTGVVDAGARRDRRDLPPTERVRAQRSRAHAPYSVAPLCSARSGTPSTTMPFVPCSVHLAESRRRSRVLTTGGGPWQDAARGHRRRGTRLEAARASARWSISTTRVSRRPRARRPRRADVDRGSRARSRSAGATLVTCPRSNGHTGAGAPPIEDFYASGVRVAVGTDSLASTPDLNVFAELATMRALAPAVPAASLLESATLQGARALGFDADYGTIEPGKRARLLAVDVPPGASDVEEYLVSGIQPDQIRWIEALEQCRVAPISRSSGSATRCSRCRSRWPARCWRARHAPVTWPTVGWILVAMVAARSAAMGFNRLVDARLDALNPRTAEPRAAARRDDARARRPRSSAVASARVRVRGVAAEPALLRAVAGRARDRVLVFARQALHDLHAAVSRPGDGGRAGRRLARGRRTRRLGAVAARRSRSARGSAASTCCMPARISSSIARTGCGRFPVRFGVPASLAISRVMHVVTVVCLARAGRSSRRCRRSTRPASALVAALLVYEQSLVRADDLSQVKRAFDLNGYVGILYFLVLAVSVYVR